MKPKIQLLVIAAVAAIGAVSYMLPVIGQNAPTSDGDAAPIYGVKLPLGYRDWRMISIADVGAPVSDLRVKLGNDVAMKAFRDDKRPFPDGTIIARLAYKQVTSEENNKVFRAAAERQGLPCRTDRETLGRIFRGWSAD